MRDWTDLVAEWHVATQVGTLLGLAALASLTVIGVVSVLARGVVGLFHGHPPAPETADDVPQCNSDDNLLGTCLNTRGCRTTEECHNTIAAIAKQTENAS